MRVKNLASHCVRVIFQLANGGIPITSKLKFRTKGADLLLRRILVSKDKFS